MKIEEGKYYRARNGEKIGPMDPDGDGNFRAIHPVKNCIAFWHRDGMRMYHDPYFDLVAEREDIPAKPKTWGEMTDEEKGALLLADHEGKPIQALALDHDGSSWVRKHLKSQWFDHVAYRVKPEPEVETVTLYSFRPDEEFGNEYRDTDTHRLTLMKKDGKLQTGEFRNDNGDIITLEEI